MKRLLGLILTIALLGVVASPAFAQGQRSCSSYSYPARRSARTYYDNRVVYDNARVYYDQNGRAYYDYEYRNRSFWERHRDKLTLAIGAGTGAAIGGLLGGKRGAIVGGLSGLGGSALYTYKIRNRGYRY